MPIKKSKEVLYMNYMKFFGIVYLLIWHSGIKKINIFVVLFFLQMFIFISGYFYKEVYSEKPLRFIRNRIKSLYIPFVSYCSLFLILNNLFVYVGIYRENMYIPYTKFGHYFLRIVTLDPIGLMAGAMWFVSSLFVISILFCFINIALQKIASFNQTIKNIEYIRFLLIISFFLFGNFLSFKNYRLPLYLDISFVLMIFYYFGYLYKKYETKISMNIFFALAAFLTLFVCSKYGLPSIVQRKYINPPFILICGVTGIYLNLYLSKKCENFRNIALVQFAGRNTMAILALHFLAFKTVSIFIIFSQNLSLDFLSSFPFIKETNQYCRWAYAVSGLILPLLGVYVTNVIFSKSRTSFRKEIE